MNFIDKIIQNSQVKEAKLYGPSKKAAERPETGITIQTPAAFHVIKDCATMTTKYLPHYVFGTYANPFEALKGKFTRADIEEFVTAAMAEFVMNQLMTLILEKIRKSPYMITPTSVNVNNITSSPDPYGDYESYTTDTTVTDKQLDPITMICTAFGV
jgi:hypothetical protein